MDSLKLGERVAEDSYMLSLGEGESLTSSYVPKVSESASRNDPAESSPKSASTKRKDSGSGEMIQHKSIRSTSQDSRSASLEDRKEIVNTAVSEAPSSDNKSDDTFYSLSPDSDSPSISRVQDKNVRLTKFVHYFILSCTFSDTCLYINRSAQVIGVLASSVTFRECVARGLFLRLILQIYPWFCFLDFATFI